MPLPFKKRRLFGSHHASDGSDAVDNGGDDGSDGCEVPFAPDPRLSAFDLSADERLLGRHHCQLEHVGLRR